MNWKLRSCLAFIVVVVAALGAPRPRVAVLLNNYAEVSPKILAIAQREAAGVYARIGIEIEWVERPLVPDEGTLAKQILPGPDRLEVRLLPRAMADRLKLRSDEIGRAMLADDGAFATIADIYTDRLVELTSSRKWALGPILGDLLAHELGHLLLGPDAHCTGGIMLPRWGERDLGEALRGQMQFTPQQAAHIRAQVLARMVLARMPEPAIDEVVAARGLTAVDNWR